MLLVAFGLWAKYAGEVYSLGPGARAWALGGAAGAAVRDPSAVFWNPGALRVAKGGALLMHGVLWSGLTSEHLCFSTRNLSGGLAGGLGLYLLGAGDIPETRLEDPTLPPSEDNPPQVVGYTSYWAYEIRGGVAKRVGSWALGVAIRALGQRAGDAGAFGAGVDLGLLRPGPVSVGLVLRDALGTYLFWDTGTKEAVLPSAELSLGLTKGKFLAAGALILRVESRRTAAPLWAGPLSAEPRLGFEYALGPASLRAGLWESAPTLGMGLGVGRFYADYALLYHLDLGATHRFSVGYRK